MLRLATVPSAIFFANPLRFCGGFFSDQLLRMAGAELSFCRREKAVAAMTFQFDCIFYYVQDLNRSIRFYAEVLGFRLMSRDAVARFDVDGVLFELVPAPPDQNPARTGNARLCLRVSDVGAAMQELRSKGVATKATADKGDGILGCFEDPDGNELCLWQYKTNCCDGELRHNIGDQ